MKKQKSLQILALAGLAATLATGCSHTSASRTDSGTDEYAAYRMSSSSGWVPITEARMHNIFMEDRASLGRNLMSHETYRYQVPAEGEAAGVVTASSFDTSLQPGDTFIEAAGADAGEVKRVILYTPFAR